MMHKAPGVEHPPRVELVLQTGHDLRLRAHLPPAIELRLKRGGGAFHHQIATLGRELTTHLRQCPGQLGGPLGSTVVGDSTGDAAIPETAREPDSGTQARLQLREMAHDSRHLGAKRADANDHALFWRGTERSEATLKGVPEAAIIG